MSKSTRLSQVMQWLWLGAVFVVFCIWMNGNMNSMLNSDYSSELILSQMLNQQGRVITPDWYYSTELRVLNTQLVFAPLFSVFSNWHTVRMTGNVILYLILLASYYYFCRQVGLKKYYAVSASVLFMPISDAYLSIVLSGVFYIPHISIGFLVFGLVFCCDKTHRRHVVSLIFLVMLSFVTGLGGPRQVFTLFMPLAIAAFFMFISRYLLVTGDKTTLQGYRAERCLLVVTVISAVSAVIGYLLNIALLGRKYHFARMESMNFEPFAVQRFEQIMNGVLTVFGYKGESNIMSLDTLGNACCFIVLTACIFAVKWLWKHRSDLAVSHKHLLFSFMLAIVALGLLYGFTDMAFSPYHLLPVVVMLLPIVHIALENIVMIRALKRIVCIVLLGVLSLNSFIVCHSRASSDPKAEIRSIATMLCEMGYNEGYATFWNGNLMTEMTDGALKVRLLSDGNLSVDVSDINQTLHWLQAVEHDITIPEGKVFVLLSVDEYKAYSLAQKLDENNVLYQSEQYLLFGYPDYVELIN